MMPVGHARSALASAMSPRIRAVAARPEWRRCFARAGMVVAFVAGVAGCTGPAPRADRPDTTRAVTFHAYVVLGEEGRPVARVITSAADCPGIELDGRIE